MFNRTAILLGQYFPLAGLLVPHAGLVAIRGLVEQGDAADAQELVGLLVPILVQARLVGFDGAAEALLDLVGLEDLAVLLGDGDVGTVHEIGQGRHAVLPLHLLERQIQGDELLEGVDHLEHQGHHFGAGLVDLGDLLLHGGEFGALGVDHLAHLLVVGAQAVHLAQGGLVLGQGRLGRLGVAVDLLLGNFGCIVGGGLSVHGLTGGGGTQIEAGQQGSRNQAAEERFLHCNCPCLHRITLSP